MLLVAGSLVIAAFKFSSKRDWAGQAIIPTLIIAFSLLLWAVTFSFPGEEVGPAVIPRLWIFWAILLSVALLVLCLLGTADKDPKSGRLGFFLLGVIIIIVYYFAIDFLGYFISSFIFLAVVMYMLSYRKFITIFLVCSGWVLFSYLVFYKLLYIQLPLGLIENFI